MATFEYKVIPAPFSGKKAKGVKGADGRFANALSEAINQLAASGWEYVRSESLPSIERHGVLRKRREVFQNVLVFRRETEITIVEEETKSSEGFNPFKRFTTKKEPVVTESPKSEPQVEAEAEPETETDAPAKSES